ncbi:hypothetical protein JHK86_033873 [Glycine max]|nr:hypothetical protein JHK86_033873 [Glycine max]
MDPRHLDAKVSLQPQHTLELCIVVETITKTKAAKKSESNESHRSGHEGWRRAMIKENCVLLVSEEKGQEPYVAIIKRCKRSSKLEDVPVDGQEIEEKKRDLVELEVCMTVEEAKEQDHGVLCQHPSPSPQFPPPSPCRHHCRLTVVCSSFCRRSRSRRHHNKLSLPTTTSTSSFEPKLEAVIDLTPLTAFQSELRRRFLSSGKDAYQDLQTLVTLDHNRRFVVSCRPSTLYFLGT